MVDFHRSLSPETVFQRYMRNLGFDERTAHERLVRICFLDYHREMALVAECEHPDPDAPRIVGVGRLSRTFGTEDAQFAVLVTDERQGKGVGTELLRRLVEVARAEGIAVLGADMRADNVGDAAGCREGRLRDRSRPGRGRRPRGDAPALITRRGSAGDAVRAGFARAHAGGCKTGCH